MKTTLAALLVLAAPAARAGAPRMHWELADVDVYGSARVTPEQLTGKYGETMRHMLNRWGITTKAAKAQAEEMRVSLERRVKELGDFGYCHLEVIDAGRTEAGSVLGLLSFDVVEKADMAKRYPFRPAPEKDVKDPSGMLDDWGRYEEMGRRAAIAAGGDLKRTACPAFYCPEGTGTSEMNAYETRFAESVPGYKQVLLQVLREDRDGAKRSAALYLLTYLHDAADVTALVTYGLNDPDVRVREAAVTILNDIAVHRKDVVVPVREVARLLDYPVASDRQRALAVMLSVSDVPDQRSFLLGPVADQVLRLLRTKDPGQRRMAHTVLTVLSGETHGETDAEAWDKWLWRARQAATRQGTKD